MISEKHIPEKAIIPVLDLNCRGEYMNKFIWPVNQILQGIWPAQSPHNQSRGVHSIDSCRCIVQAIRMNCSYPLHPRNPACAATVRCQAIRNGHAQYLSKSCQLLCCMFLNMPKCLPNNVLFLSFIYSCTLSKFLNYETCISAKNIHTLICIFIGSHYFKHYL